MLQLDARSGADLREAGMQLALTFAGDWSQEIVVEFRGWAAIEKARGITEVTIERFRVEARHQPERHFAWGSAPRLLCKAGLLRPKLRDDGSQVTRKAASPKTHSHDVRVWILA